MNAKNLHELIDACRPGHDDVSQPEFGELARELTRNPQLQQLFERSQELDAAIQATFRSVTPPPGAAARLLKAIEQRENTSHVTEVEPRVEPASRRSRRQFAIGASVASMSAVAAAITVWFFLPQPMQDWSEAGIAELVDSWNADLNQTPWQTTSSIPSRDFPTWQHLDLRGVSGWQWVSTRRIACYDFATDSGSVRLFVMNSTAPIALPRVPPVGYPSSNGWHVGAWQANGRVYFLAVRARDDSGGLYSRVTASPITPA